MWKHKEQCLFRSMCVQCTLAWFSLGQGCVCQAAGSWRMLLGAGLGTRQLNLKA